MTSFEVDPDEIYKLFIKIISYMQQNVNSLGFVAFSQAEHLDAHHTQNPN